MRRTWIVALVVSTTGTACLADQLESPPSGVFACIDDGDCPAGQVCAFDRCEAGDLPRLEIRAPEAKAVVSTIEPGDTPPPTVTVPITIGGGMLELVEAGTVSRVGEGIVEVYVDDDAMPQRVLTTGSLVAGIATEIEMDNTPGAHRVRAVASLSDGRSYEGSDADVTTLVWIDDGLPHVALAQPTPGSGFGLGVVSLTVEVTTLHFDMVQAATLELPGNVGHAHVHYDESFPACVDDSVCDNRYIGIVAPTQGGAFDTVPIQVTLPASGEGTFSLTAVLRHSNHSVFLGEDDDLDPIFETISIERDASIEAEEQPG